MTRQRHASTFVENHRNQGAWDLEWCKNHCGGPHNKGYSILGSVLGSPYLGKLSLGFRVEVFRSLGLRAQRRLWSDAWAFRH